MPLSMTTTVRFAGRSLPSVHMTPVLSRTDPSLSIAMMRRCGRDTESPSAVGVTEPRIPVKNVLSAGLWFHQSSQVWPIDVVSRSSLVTTCAMWRMTSILCIGRHLHAFAGEDHGDRPVARIGVIISFLDGRLDLVEPSNEAEWDAQRVQDWLHGLRVIVAPPVALAPLAAKAHGHDQRHGVAIGKAGDRLAGLPQSRILHHHEALFAGEVGSGADARQLRLVGHRNVADGVVLCAQAIDACQKRFRHRGNDGHVGFLQPLDEQLGVARWLRARLHDDPSFSPEVVIEGQAAISAAPLMASSRTILVTWSRSAMKRVSLRIS